MSQLKISLKKEKKYLKNLIEFGVDDKYNSKALGQKGRKKGVYIISTQDPEKIIYVGKTRGSTMYFSKRLRRHAQKGASGNSRVYKKLKEISNQDRPLKVSLINKNKVKEHFKTIDVDFSEAAMIDTLEQVLIHYLNPVIQEEN